MFQLYLILIFCFICAIRTNENENIDNYDFYEQDRIQLVNSDKYMFNVTQQFIYELEDYGVCNTMLQNMTQKITRLDNFGYDVVGTVYYTNGFLSTFQEVSLKQEPQLATIDKTKNSAHMSMELIFSSLIMFYDYFADLTEAKFSGTVAIPMNNFGIKLYVDKYFDNNTIDYHIDVVATQFARTKVWDYVPSNHYTEIINKDIILEFDNSLVTSVWNISLGRAIKKIPFPKLCLNC